jgi:adenine-specific DNA-methyltransferase
MAIQKIQPSYKFNEEQLKQLRQIAPEAFKDNILDFNTLYEALAESIGDDEFETEHYGLNWPGKKNAKKIFTQPTKCSLAPIALADSKHIFIEGENLEILKLLKKAYAGQIKVIYLDPPYNTGKDFIYDDDFTESIDEFLLRTGQVDIEGKRTTTNSKSDGRFHSKWLSFMYPRIKIAHSLLKDDGVLFVSIDDNEIQNLKLLLNEIFGEENFLANLIWNKQHSQQQGIFKKYHEYVLLYAKDNEVIGNIKGGTGDIDAGALKKISRANPASTFEFPAGVRFEAKDGTILSGTYGDSEKVTIVKGKLISKGGVTAEPVTLSAGWTQKNQMIKYFNGEEVFDSKGQLVKEFYFNSKGKLKCKKERSKITPSTILPLYGMVSEQTAYIEKLFGKPVFDNPKPVKMLSEFIDWFMEDGDIILDFFAGSGTTGDAALRHEKNINFILCQLPEAIDDTSESGKNAIALGYRKISQITKARLERVIQQLKDEEITFSHYCIAKSSFKVWQNYSGTDSTELVNLFSQFESSLIDDWKPENLLTEILLIEGFPLDSKIEAVETFRKNKVQKITSDFCEHALFVCLDKKVEDETIKALSLSDNDIFICLDNSVTDQDKARLDDKGLIKTI